MTKREFAFVDIQSDISFSTAQEALEHLLRCDIDFVQETLAAVFGIEHMEAAQ